MPASGRTPRDERRRRLGQNFLADPRVVSRLVADAQITSDDLIVEFGAGNGALTIPLARSGARVIAVERDPVWARQLRGRLADARLTDRVQVVVTDLRRFRLPKQPYRVVANPPFGLTTTLLGLLLDDPAGGPERADLLIQRDVAVKRTHRPPTTLRSAAWAPWWEFELGMGVDRRAFRPVPTVDAAVLTIRRRHDAVLPEWLAPQMRQLLKEAWQPPAYRKGSTPTQRRRGRPVQNSR